MRFDEYRALDATAMAELITRGDVTASELLECAHARHQQVNGQINGIVTPMFTNAHRYLSRHNPAGKLAGVPLVLKDLLGHFPRVPTSSGSRAYQYIMQTVPSTLVDRLCKQGAVVIGKTNTPELGLLATTENRAFGATRNPWNILRTAGGSSGGTAASVAAGIVPLGTAGDGGGSIRIPASCCGLFGLKPTRGLVPSGPEFGEVWDGAVSEHVITRSVRDSALVLSIIAGQDSASHTPQNRSCDHFDARYSEAPEKLRIAFTTASPLGGKVSVHCRTAVEKTARLLQNLGHSVEEAMPVIPAEAIIKAYTDIYIAHVTAEISQLKMKFGRQFARNSVEPLTLFISRVGQRFSAGDFVTSRLLWVELQQKMALFHEQYDMWLTPTMADSPYPLGSMTSSNIEQALIHAANTSGLYRLVPVKLLYQFSSDQMQKVPFTQIANLTGQPAMSMPLHWDLENLPVGVQIVGPAGSDLRLLQLARQLEEAQPWFEHVAPL